MRLDYDRDNKVAIIGTILESDDASIVVKKGTYSVANLIYDLKQLDPAMPVVIEGNGRYGCLDMLSVATDKIEI